METESVEIITAKKRLEEAEATLDLIRRRGHWEYEQEAILNVEIAAADLRLAMIPVAAPPTLWASHTLHTLEGRKGGV